MSESGQGTGGMDAGAARALPVDAVIERFGGIRPMASKLDVPVTTVQGWKERGQIPERRWPEIEAAAARHGVSLASIDGGVSASPWTEPSAASSATSPPLPFSPSSPGPRAAVPPPPRRGGRLRALGALVLLLVAAAGIAYVGWRSDYVRARLPGGTQSAGSDMPSTSPPLPAPSPAMPATSLPRDEMTDRLASLEAKVADGGAVAALRAENERMAGEISALKNQITGFERERALRARQRERAQSFLSAVENLRAAAAGAGSYAAALDLVSAAVGDDPKVAEALKPLYARAELGVPTRQMLAARFDSVAADAMRAEAGGKSGLWGNVAEQVAHLIVVRRTGARAPAGSVEAALWKSDVSLRSGDLAGAVAALDGVPEPASSAVDPWLDDARARLSLDRTVASLEARVVAVFASGEATP
ncbi:MAG: mitofilin family membrane protein [Alphaproteobacteria bacterium]|nr:mitofilin family membrane protein [Alphaproteobacteria bacterium]